MTSGWFVYGHIDESWMCVMDMGGINVRIQNIDKMNVMTSGWFVYGHIDESWMCVMDMGGINLRI